MLSLSQSILLGLLQGLTELFPISSLGHTVILPSLLGWQIDQSNSFFLGFIVATHLATALTLLGFFWRDWLKIIRGIFRSLTLRIIDPSDTYAKLGWLLIVATIPGGLLGLLFQNRLQQLFATPKIAALFLFGNGLLLFAAEFLRKKNRRKASLENLPQGGNDAEIAALSWGGAVKVGFLQSLALLPGFSRTGSSLAGGLLEGLSHENAARFSFLLATPIIFAAAVLKLPQLTAGAGSQGLFALFIGALCAALTAYISVRFLSRYFKTNTLIPFALYCVLAGLLAFFVIA